MVGYEMGDAEAEDYTSGEANADIAQSWRGDEMSAEADDGAPAAEMDATRTLALRSQRPHVAMPTAPAKRTIGDEGDRGGLDAAHLKRRRLNEMTAEAMDGVDPRVTYNAGAAHCSDGAAARRR